MKKKFLIGILPVVAFIGLIIILHMNMLFPWQAEHRANKKAILEYVQEKYPNSKRKGGIFPMQKFLEFHKASTMYFDLDGIEFRISAEYGEIVVDGYPKARATAQFDKIIKDGFLKPRKINSSVIYSFQDDYRKTYPYTGSLYVELRVFNQGSTPQEVGWIYDFYKYWKTEGSFLKEYQVNILIYESDVKVRCAVVITNDSEFADKNEFYSAFKNIGS